MNNPQSVLLIEDDENDQYFFVQAINSIHNITMFGIAKNGKDALKKLETSEILPDIIFSDINMPVMDGIECLTEIKKMPKTKDIPVIVLSSDARQINTVRRMGASGFIEKTNDWSGLNDKLKKVLDTDFDSHRKMANEVFLIL